MSSDFLDLRYIIRLIDSVRNLKKEHLEAQKQVFITCLQGPGSMFTSCFIFSFIIALVSSKGSYMQTPNIPWTLCGQPALDQRGIEQMSSVTFFRSAIHYQIN